MAPLIKKINIYKILFFPEPIKSHEILMYTKQMAKEFLYDDF